VKRKQLYTLFLCCLVPWTIGNGVTPLLPVYASELGAKPSFVGYYLSISWLALTIGTFTAGWLSDRFQKRKAILIGAGTLAVPIAWLMGQVTTAWQLTVLTPLLWFFGGIGLTLLMTIAGLFAGEDERGKIFGILTLTEAIGTILGGFTTGNIVDRWDYETLFIFIAFIQGLLPLIGLFLEDKTASREEEEQPVENTESRFGVSFYLILLANTIVSIAFFVYTLGESLYMNSLNFSLADITGVAAVGALVSLPVIPYAGRLSDRLNRKLLLALCFFIGGGSLIILSMSTQLWHFWVASALAITQGFVGTTVGLALTADIVPKESLGKGVAMFHSTYWIGGIIGFSLAGLAIETLGTRTSFIVSAMVVFSAILLVFLAQKQPAKVEADPSV